MSDSVLHLVVQLGRDRYVLAASQVLEIITVVRLKPLPGAPIGVAGLMNYRGSAVPVVDLALVATGTPVSPTTAARIVVLQFPVPSRPGEHDALGLLVAAAHDTVRLDPQDFVDSGVVAGGAPCFGLVLATPDGVLQRVEPAVLLTPELRAALFRRAEGA